MSTKVTEVKDVNNRRGARRAQRPGTRDAGGREWNSGGVTGAPPSSFPTEWLSLPDLVELTGEPLGRVRRLLDEKQLIGSRRDGVFRVPAAFLLDGHPVTTLRGTVIVLQDAGFSDDEAIDWLMETEESIGMAPIEALRAGRKSEVRRVAQALA